MKRTTYYSSWGIVFLTILSICLGTMGLKAAAIALYCRISSYPILPYLPQALNPLGGDFVHEKLLSGNGPEASAGFLIILFVFVANFFITFFPALSMYLFPAVRKGNTRILGLGALATGLLVSSIIYIVLRLTHFQWDYFELIHQDSIPLLLPFSFCGYCLAVVVTALTYLVVHRATPGEMTTKSESQPLPIRIMLSRFAGYLTAGIALSLAAILVSTQPLVATELLLQCCARGDVGELNRFAPKASDLNRQSHRGQRVLQMACFAAQPEVVEFLLTHGAEPGTPDFFGITPLNAACLGGNPQIVERILAAGIRPETTAITCAVEPIRLGMMADSIFTYSVPERTRPQREASQQMEIVALLLGHGGSLEPIDGGISPLAAASEAGNPQIVEFLISRGAMVNFTDGRGESALMFAAAEARDHIVRLLLARGADVNIAAKNHATALYYTIAGRMARPEKDVEKRLTIARLLIAKHAETNVKVYFGSDASLFSTPLDHSNILGHEMVLLLLQNGADPRLKPYLGQNLANAAQKNGWQDVLAILQNKGFLDNAAKVK